ncbi:hypothetical protein PV327_003457 [Microctonus hyperodae]|uniref:GTP-binding protein RAD n=1 Tax=Microctonus hyperodae TaxID=165561 RepID=A0AA39L176_MICHY|nr:hypothetical protein PV327_003457 [Microctonus hyperodae]
MVTMITTTDSEQRDDSLDLIDDTNELSPPLPPPPLPPPTSMNSSSPTKNGPHNPDSLSKNLTTAITQATTAPIIQPNPETTLNADKSPVNGIGAPPPTPLIGARHESKFTFPTGRIPALPDIRTADFFSVKFNLCLQLALARCAINYKHEVRSGSGSGTKRTAQATIVVQQPSLSFDSPAATLLLRPDMDAQRREENMRQLRDVANALTLQEIHDFEMRYGSPHHSRSQSVKTPGSRSSGRPNYLCLPQQRSRVASMPNTGVEEEYYRLRHFSITGKGIVNRGDSLKSRRSRSNNSVASSNSSTEHLTASYPGSARNSAAGSLASSRESSASQGPAPYKVLMLGAQSVGKSSLVSQFMTSEYLHAYDTSIDDESGEKTVSVLLAEEESELTFIDHSCADMTPEKCISTYEPHAYCVVYSTIDRASVRVAEEVLQTLWRSDHVSARAVILVGNKVDLVRSRSVAVEEGKSMATSYDCKFIETSVGMNYNVDELLVGLLTQIRLKLENPERTRDLFRKRSRKNRSRSPLGSCSENNSPKKYRGSRTSASLKVRNLLGKVWARDSKSKSCENLHVL